MTADAASSSAASRPARGPARGQGQWALGFREPLNANERFKADDDGLNVRARIENIYSRRGFASIDPADLNGRMRWWGLYTQRRPGIEGGRTATLEPHELSDEYFMLRVRSDGGRLDLAQLRAIAHVSTTYGRDTADITDRQNIQLHWIRVEDVPAIWAALEAVGLTTAEACGDTPRVLLGSPVAGVAADEIIDGTPAIEEVVRTYIGDPSLSNLPAQVQDRRVRLAEPGRRPRDQRRLVRRRGPPRARSRLRRVRRGRPLDQPDVRQAPGRLRHPRRDPRGVARDHPGLPRLRLPPAAQQGPAEVPRGGLGTGAVPRGPRDRVPRPHPDRRSGSRRTAGAPRPRRRPPPARRALLRRRGAGRRPGQRHHPGCRRRPRRGRRQRPGPAHRPAEAVGARRRRGCGAGAHRGARRPRPGHRAERVPARHDGLHRPGVLQARHRRDQGPGRRDGRRARGPAARLRPPPVAPRQRLPQLLRPHPGRRHRAQGPDRRRTTRATRSRASRCTWAASSAPRTSWGASRAASRSPAPTSPTTSSASPGASRSSAAEDETFAAWAQRADEEALA